MIRMLPKVALLYAARVDTIGHLKNLMLKNCYLANSFVHILSDLALIK